MAAETRGDRIRLVHGAVRGRVRFEVAGLYRAPATARALERELEGVTGVRRVSANVLTGRLLVIYLPSRAERSTR